MDLTIPKTKECWRCALVLRGDGEVHVKHCPRCAVALDSLIDANVISDEDMAKRRSWYAAADLATIYSNWAKGYKRLMDEAMEPDYSSLDDFIYEVMEHSMFYLKRLVDEEILDEDGLAYVRNALNDCTLDILDHAERMRRNLIEFGEWKVEDEETRRYWLDRIRICNYALSSPKTCGAKQITCTGKDRKG